MGKGDIKSAKGKRNKGSFGVSRLQKKRNKKLYQTIEKKKS